MRSISSAGYWGWLSHWVRSWLVEWPQWSSTLGESRRIGLVIMVGQSRTSNSWTDWNMSPWASVPWRMTW